MSPLAPVLQGFFTDKLIAQRQASPNTVAAYRSIGDTCRLLLDFASKQTRKQPCQLDLAGRVAQVVGGSGVRAAICPLRLGGDIPQGRPAATVRAIVTALEAVTPGAGTESGRVRGRGHDPGDDQRQGQVLLRARGAQQRGAGPAWRPSRPLRLRGRGAATR